MKYSYVFWDWNGTIIDDMDCSMAAVNSMLEKRKMQLITREQYYEYIDTPIKRFYEHIFDLDKITMSEIMLDFNYFYTLHLSDNPLMEGAESVLKELDRAGILQIVLSSSSNDMIMPLAKKTGISRYFRYILGSSDSLVNSKTERAKRFITDNGIEPKNCVIIGDTLHDYDTAEAMGCDCILIPKGHQASKDLIPTGAFIAEDIRAAVKVLF